MDLGYVLVWCNVKVKYQLIHQVSFSFVLFWNKCEYGPIINNVSLVKQVTKSQLPNPFD
jgi:hypothetical protein